MESEILNFYGWVATCGFLLSLVVVMTSIWHDWPPAVWTSLLGLFLFAGIGISVGIFHDATQERKCAAKDGIYIKQLCIIEGKIVKVTP